MTFALLEPVNSALGAHPDESWLGAWLLDLEIESTFHAMDGDGWAAWQDLRLLNVALAMSPEDGAHRREYSLGELFSLRPTRELLQINEYDGVEYFNREQFESMIGRLSLLHAITTLGDTTLQPPERATAVQDRLQWALTVQQEAENAGFRVSTLLEWEQGKQSPPKALKAKSKNAAKPRAKKRG
jgi:hypothetical protein